MSGEAWRNGAIGPIPGAELATLLAGVEGGAEGAPLARPGDGLDGPGDAVAAEQQPGLPAQVPGLGLLAVGEGDDRPGGQIEPGFDDAVIAEGDPQARVRA